MRILRLSTTHFRNLSHESLSFSPGVNLIVGENGHGKTNLLEAIYLFKFGRSFRTQRDAELVRFGEEFCRVEVEITHAAGDSDTFEASIEKSGAKTLKVSGKEIGRHSELIGRYPCVLFGPQDLSLVSGFPGERRRFVDMVGSMTDPSYLEALRGYRRVLAQRNSVLKAGGHPAARRVWDEELVARGAVLLLKRHEVVAAIDRFMKPHIEALALPHAPTVSYDTDLGGVGMGEVTVRERFAHQLGAVDREERRRRTTLVGPHRDDVGVRYDGRDVRRYGSQGQRRLCAVLLRLAELSYLESELHEPCVLLLDDLFSELDVGVAGRLKGLLDGTHQVFVTSPVTLAWHAGVPACRFRVTHGNLSAEHVF